MAGNSQMAGMLANGSPRHDGLSRDGQWPEYADYAPGRHEQNTDRPGEKSP